MYYLSVREVGGGIFYMEEKQNSLSVGVLEKISHPQKISHPRISVIIPAKNEAKNLPHVLPYIPSMVEEVILG